MQILLIIVLATHAFCNGYMVAVTDQKRQEEEDDNLLSFGTSWDKEVSESQDTKVGCFLMKAFYIIPTMVGMISKHKNSHCCKQ